MSFGHLSVQLFCTGENPTFPPAKPAVCGVPKKPRDICTKASKQGIREEQNSRMGKIKFLSLHELRVTLQRFWGCINSREAGVGMT